MGDLAGRSPLADSLLRDIRTIFQGSLHLNLRIGFDSLSSYSSSVEFAKGLVSSLSIGAGLSSCILGRTTAKMADDTAPKRRCIGLGCQHDAGSLQCPTCLKLGKESYFCSQDCFKRSWVGHAFTRCCCTENAYVQATDSFLGRTQSYPQSAK